jgi:Domain of unknown function (DUF4157)
MTPQVAQRQALGQALQMKRDAETARNFPGGIPQRMNTLPRKGEANGQGLPPTVQPKMEATLGTDLSTVKVHADSGEAQQMGARAFTQGDNVHFAPGQYDTQSQKGQELIGHEMAHVKQQREGRVQATKQMKGVGLNDDRGLEREADVMGKKAAQASSPAEMASPMALTPQAEAGAGIVQRDCNIPEALAWYATSKTGQKVVWSTELVEQLHRFVGSSEDANAAASTKAGKIDESFVLLVCAVQTQLGYKGDDLDGKLGPTTKAALDTKQTGGEHGLDYGRLLKDKKLQIGVAVGYDEGSNDDLTIKEVLAVLMDPKNKLTATIGSEKTTFKGKRMYSLPGDKLTAPFEVQIEIDLVTPDHKNPKNTFASFLSSKEIAIYDGHARYGTGPDFDVDTSTDQNFVLGVNSKLHDEGKLTKGYDDAHNKLLKGKPNDLETMSKAGKFDMNSYQVWFMNGCKTKDYKDEIRGGLVASSKGTKKSKTDLRLVGTNDSIYPGAMDILLQGLLDMKSMEEILAAFEKDQHDQFARRKEAAPAKFWFAD